MATRFQALVLALMALVTTLPALAEESGSVDLGISVSVSPSDTVNPGATLTYTLIVSNHSSTDASDVVVTNTIPDGTTYLGALSTATDLIFEDGFESGDVNGWDTGYGGCSEDDGVVTCEISTLAGLTQETIIVEAAVNSGVTGTITNDASVTGSQSELDDSDNTDSISSLVEAGSADVGISVSDSPDPVTVGSTLTYTLTITNFGPAIATGVIVDDFLPLQLDQITVTEPDEGCDVSVNTVSCDLGSLGVGSQATVVIETNVLPQAFPALTNPASVSTTSDDPNPVNDTDTENTAVDAR
ncbi:MAG: DUF11 domain-containing protein [bacterium]|nr:DUF11 domain-containing protein [bacterium]